VSLATGWKKLDALVQASWYCTQITRLARGRDPHPGLGRLRAVISYLLGTGRQRGGTGPGRPIGVTSGRAAPRGDAPAI
jgi:hypothetical protein